MPVDEYRDYLQNQMGLLVVRDYDWLIMLQKAGQTWAHIARRHFKLMASTTSYHVGAVFIVGGILQVDFHKYWKLWCSARCLALAPSQQYVACHHTPNLYDADFANMTTTGNDCAWRAYCHQLDEDKGEAIA